MPLQDEILSRLKGTRQLIFKILNLTLKNSSGILEIRNDTDTAYANVESHSIKLHGTNALNGVTITVPGAMGSNVTLTLPSDDGATNQVLATNGSGVLSWVDVSSNSNLVQTESFTQATSSPLTIFTPTSGTYILSVVVEVTSAASGGNPTVQLGTVSDPNAYVDTDEINLNELGVYIVNPHDVVIGSPDAVVLSIAPDSQTFSGRIFVNYSTPS
jgi:hypothetical protein